MQLARGVGQVFARKGEAQRNRAPARDARHRARGEQAPERGLAALPATLLRRLRAARSAIAARAAPASASTACSARLASEIARSGIPQRIARLAPVGFPALEFGAERFDARAQGGEVLLSRRTGRRARQPRRGRAQRRKAVQALAFPCAETAATRFAISAGVAEVVVLERAQAASSS